MIYLNNEDRQREALAMEGVRALVTVAGWQAQPCPVMFPPALADFLFSPANDLILAHWCRHISIGRLFAAARETRMDILLVEPAWIATGGPAFGATLILCREGETNVYRGLRLWANDVEGPAWLVPDPADRDLDQRFFELSQKRIAPTDLAPFGPAPASDGLLVGRIRWKAVLGGHLI